MAVTIGGDYNVEHSNDSVTNTNAIDNINAPTASDTDIKVQGTGSSRARHNGVGVGGTSMGFTNKSVRDKHILAWVQSLDKVNTLALAGWRIRIAANGNFTANFDGFNTSGDDVQVAFYSGFQILCQDPGGPVRQFQGTPPVLSSIGEIHVVNDAITTSSRETWFVDAVATYSFLQISGGTETVPGNSSDVAANDRTNGRGIFKNSQGVMYILGKMQIGHATVLSHFTDSNESWVFESSPVAVDFHGIEFIGGASVVNAATFGVLSGTGVDEEGTGGNFFRSADMPYFMDAIDSNITVGLFGCTFVNGKKDGAVGTAFRGVQTVDASGGPSFVDNRRNAALNSTSSFVPFPVTEAVGDYCVFGQNRVFGQVFIGTGGTIGVGGVVVWEYWNGTAWSALLDLYDGSEGFTVTGNHNAVWNIPPDWAKNTINGENYFHIRVRITTVYSTNPAITIVRPTVAGGFRFEQANCKVIRGNFIECGPIVVRNGAFLKKSVITDALLTEQHGAVDLGATDPAANTVRDLVIQNSSKGILLQKLTTGNVTYNFRNIKFSNNDRTDIAWRFETPSTYVQITDECNSASADINFFPTDAFQNGDICYIGDEAQFDEIEFNIGTAGTGAYDFVVQYWNGSAWTAVAGEVDDTDHFKNVGINTISFTRPSNWKKALVNGATAYFIRLVLGTVTVTIKPIGIYVRIPGDVRVDFPTASTVTINLLEGSDVPSIDNVNGSTVNIVANTSITFTGLKDNSEIRIYDSGTGVEIAGIEDATAGTADDRTFAWSDAAANVVDYVIHNWQPGVTTYQTIRVNDFTVPGSDASIAIQQQVDRNAS